MQDSASNSQNSVLRRQRIILVTGVAMAATYYLLRVVPGTLGSGVAVCVALGLAACGFFAAGFATISNRRRRTALLLTTSLLVLTLFVALAPNFRRASLQRQLRDLGATVTSDTDAGDGIWFHYHGVYLPCWIRDHLGDAFFGPIDEVDFSNADVPVDGIAKLEFAEPIAKLNLSGAHISNDDLVRLTRMIDARQVLLNHLPADAKTLDAFGRMGSLSHIAAIETDISPKDATDFVVRHPTIKLVHGDRLNGYGFVRAPITEP